jgi:hypothetical protein
MPPKKTASTSKKSVSPTTKTPAKPSLKNSPRTSPKISPRSSAVRTLESQASADESLVNKFADKKRVTVSKKLTEKNTNLRNQAVKRAVIASNSSQDEDDYPPQKKTSARKPSKGPAKKSSSPLQSPQRSRENSPVTSPRLGGNKKSFSKTTPNADLNVTEDDVENYRDKTLLSYQMA